MSILDLEHRIRNPKMLLLRRIQADLFHVFPLTRFYSQAILKRVDTQNKVAKKNGIGEKLSEKKTMLMKKRKRKFQILKVES